MHREVALPAITDAKYMRLAEFYVPYYLKRDGIRGCLVNIDRNVMEYMTSLIGALKLTPRQIQEVFRILGHTLTRPKGTDGNLFWNLAVGTISMAAFKIGYSRIYSLLGNKMYEPDEAHRFLSEHFVDESPEWWFTLFLTGGGLRLGKDDTDESILIKHGFLNGDNKEEHRKYLAPFYSAWGHASSSRFVQIHDMIEHIVQWK